MEGVDEVEFDEQEEEESKSSIKRKDPTKFHCRRKKYKIQAADAFHCSPFSVKPFKVQDCFCKSNYLGGYMNHSHGLSGGSFLLLEINTTILRVPQMIYGTPKLKYPYESFESFDYSHNLTKKPIAKYYLSNKWNGTNILFYKYLDENNQICIGAKTKGVPTLKDTDFGNFYSWTIEALDISKEQSLASQKPPLLQELFEDANLQSITFEICGNALPHLVAYDFSIDLKPLFKTFNDGRIKPIIKEDGIGPIVFTSYQEMIIRCQECQKDCLERNEQFRNERHLPHRYEYNHFAIEGYVLYLLDDEGYLIDRTMYKIKPKDVEEVHWETFNDLKMGQVKDALQKMKERQLDFKNDQVIREELDMGEKEWGKFGENIKSYIQYLEQGSRGIFKPSRGRQNNKSKETNKE